MNRKSCVIPLLIAGLWACQPDQDQRQGDDPAADLDRELPGTWQMIDLQVDINTAGGQDTAVVFEIREAEWERVYNVQPKRSYFKPDHTYREEFRSILDSVISANTGNWRVQGDSLHLTEPDTSYHYQVELGSGVATFQSVLDWDGDGARDDDYTARYRRISRSAGN